MKQARPGTHVPSHRRYRLVEGSKADDTAPGTRLHLPPFIDPAAMHPLGELGDTVHARDVFHDPRTWEEIIDHARVCREYEKRGSLPETIEDINAMKTPDGFVPEAMSHQELIGIDVIRQARLVGRAPFLKAVTLHPGCREIPGFLVQKRVIRDTLTIFNLLRSMGNLFRRHKIHTMMGSLPEVKLAWQCFGPLWPAGTDMYGILGDLYPAFHARMTGHVPAYVAEHLDEMLDNPVSPRDIHGMGSFLVDAQGRFLGLYPVSGIPAEHLTLDSPFISQDQAGRRALVSRVVSDILELFSSGRKGAVIVMDYAGGVGNLSELLLKTIHAMDDPVLRTQLIRRVKTVVVDMAEDQLAAGRKRIGLLQGKPGLQGIRESIYFLRGDVTKPIGMSRSRRFLERFGLGGHERPTFLGMTSYTLGALDAVVDREGNTCTHAMAREICRQCEKVYAVDFSSPMWRLDGFLKDTRRWGDEYLRAVHGRPSDGDESRPIPRAVRRWLSVRYGLHCRTTADLVRSMAIVPGLAAHYISVWPGRDGHNSGYAVLEDGTMKKPGILSFARSLASFGASVRYRSKVWLVATLDLGRTTQGHRAWAMVPGWVADFMVADTRHV